MAHAPVENRVVLRHIIVPGIAGDDLASRPHAEAHVETDHRVVVQRIVDILPQLGIEPRRQSEEEILRVPEVNRLEVQAVVEPPEVDVPSTASDVSQCEIDRSVSYVPFRFLLGEAEDPCIELPRFISSTGILTSTVPGPRLLTSGCPTLAKRPEAVR